MNDEEEDSNGEEAGETKKGLRKGPRLLYRASRRLMSEQGRTKWRELGTFMAGTPQSPLTKEAFYARLSATPPAQLPSVTEVLEVTYEEMATWARSQQVRSEGWEVAQLEQAVHLSNITSMTCVYSGK